jgi:hypothetical protein
MRKKCQEEVYHSFFEEKKGLRETRGDSRGSSRRKEKDPAVSLDLTRRSLSVY